MSYETWNSITIKSPGDLTIETLPDALTRDGGAFYNYDAFDHREGMPPMFDNEGVMTWEGTPGDPDGAIVISGHTKYQADEAVDAIIELSKTLGTIEHQEEGHYDDNFENVNVYRDGELIVEESKHSALVPDNLPELIAAVRRRVRRNRHGDVETEGGRDAMEAVMALLDALDPTGAQK